MVACSHGTNRPFIQTVPVFANGMGTSLRLRRLPDIADRNESVRSIEQRAGSIKRVASRFASGSRTPHEESRPGALPQSIDDHETQIAGALPEPALVVDQD